MCSSGRTNGGIEIVIREPECVHQRDRLGEDGLRQPVDLTTQRLDGGRESLRSRGVVVRRYDDAKLEQLGQSSLDRVEDVLLRVSSRHKGRREGEHAQSGSHSRSRPFPPERRPC